MRPGDLVNEREWVLLEHYKDSLRKNGIILDVKMWEDSDKEKNQGVRVKVMWGNGDVEVHEPDELEVVFND